MILDLLWTIIHAVIAPLFSLLPDGNLSLPGAGDLASYLCQVDAVLPILGPLSIVLLFLAAVPVFFGLRVMLVMWNAVKP